MENNAELKKRIFEIFGKIHNCELSLVPNGGKVIEKMQEYKDWEKLKKELRDIKNEIGEEAYMRIITPTPSPMGDFLKWAKKNDEEERERLN